MVISRIAAVLLLIVLAPFPVGAAPEGRVVIAQGVDPTTLDMMHQQEQPASNVGAQIYESLVESYRGEIKPAIAESWEQSSDGLTLTFKLRDNAFFHGGRKVTSADVKYSIERIKNPATRAPRASRVPARSVSRRVTWV